jgi:CRISPR-associated protein Cas6
MVEVAVRSAVADSFLLPHVDLDFPIVSGDFAPADHGYAVYSAISHASPEIHSRNDISIHTITGQPDEQGKILLGSRSAIKIRLPYDAEIIQLLLPLAGKKLKLGIHEIQLGIPRMSQLEPASLLKSRIVTIKKFQEPELFLDAVKRQLAVLEIVGTAIIPFNRKGEADRKAIKIKTYSIVGFGVEIGDLSDEDSIKLQIAGLGGKHKMGCGIFNPLPHRGKRSYE